MIPLIIIVLVVTGIISLWRITVPHQAMMERTVLSDQEYLAELRSEARGMRCPHPGYKGRKTACKRAPGRPCVPGCTGRKDISTDWHGN